MTCNGMSPNLCVALRSDFTEIVHSVIQTPTWRQEPVNPESDYLVCALMWVSLLPYYCLCAVKPVEMWDCMISKC